MAFAQATQEARFGLSQLSTGFVKRVEHTADARIEIGHLCPSENLVLNLRELVLSPPRATKWPLQIYIIGLMRHSQP